MDEGVEIDSTLPWDIENIDENQVVYRQIPASKRTGNRPKKYPAEGNFALKDNEDSLSFNWERYIDIPKNFSLLSITANSKGTLIDYTGFVIFKYPVSFLKSMEKFQDIKHSPLYIDCPSPVGKPNNKSHVSLYYDENDQGVRAQLSDYCLDNFEFSNCDFPISSIKHEIEELRNRNNDTPYHNLWEFD
ncbi:MAG: hypothetical protein EOP34_10805 [Rickettsiales bacterium]|nr:MAG: hypothetical protein EOP34_10805 [Rickettsiales bacterium]